MATNNFKAFAQASSANVMSQADYESLAALLTGFQSGKASSAQINKALRQSSVMAYVLAQFISDSANVDVLDNGTPAAILANMKAAMTAFTPGRLLRTTLITTSGTFTPAEGMKNCRVRGVGGGAGSGIAAVTSSSQFSVSGGGAAGSFSEGWFNSAQIGSGVPVTVGSGGAGGNSTLNYGGSGGSSSFGSLMTCPGGGGSAAGVAVSTSGSALSAGGSAGSVATGGSTINSVGTAGGYGIQLTQLCIAGSGGSNPLGSGGQGLGVSSQATAGSGYGAGAAGAANGSSISTIKNGATGSQGCFIVEEFA